jgi:hypothetical protein
MIWHSVVSTLKFRCTVIIDCPTRRQNEIHQDGVLEFAMNLLALQEGSVIDRFDGPSNQVSH